MDVLAAFLERHQVPSEELVRVGKAKLMRQWWNAFAAPHKQPGQSWPPIPKDSMWEVFSAGCAPYLQGPAAWETFAHVPASQFLIIPSNRCPLYECDGTVCEDLPRVMRDLQNFLETEGRECLDVYVMDSELRWTWVFTHETDWGMGPYYAQAASSCRRERLDPTGSI